MSSSGSEAHRNVKRMSGSENIEEDYTLGLMARSIQMQGVFEGEQYVCRSLVPLTSWGLIE